MQTATEKPSWLNKKVNLKECRNITQGLEGLGLKTVCQEAACPNISECFSNNEATFLILGENCTRACGFCNITKATPSGIDRKEPARVAEAVERLGLRHVVVTSVTRDDLDDGGAEIFAQTISLIRERKADTSIEVLIPDFQGMVGPLEKITEAAPDIIAHNIETVPRLYKDVRPKADYYLSIALLKMIKQLGGRKRIFTKSGLMLGMGEAEDEVLQVLSDLRSVGCSFLSIGQYLSPSRLHVPVKEYISPYKFLCYKEKAERLGFLHVESSPYTRSSYRAGGYLHRVQVPERLQDTFPNGSENVCKKGKKKKGRK